MISTAPLDKYVSDTRRWLFTVDLFSTKVRDAKVTGQHAVVEFVSTLVNMIFYRTVPTLVFAETEPYCDHIYLTVFTELDEHIPL